jgi:hypothetical protein
MVWVDYGLTSRGPARWIPPFAAMGSLVRDADGQGRRLALWGQDTLMETTADRPWFMQSSTLANRSAQGAIGREIFRLASENRATQ